MIDITALPVDIDARRVYAVGDIHGRLDLLLQIEAAIDDDIAAHPRDTALVVYLGDYIDRGPASEGVVELLAGHRVSRPRRVFLKGNHEDRMLAFLDDPAVQGPGWMKFGGREALLSYGVSDADLETEDWPHIRDRLVNGLPQRHLAFLTGLEMALRWRNYLFVHAGLNPARGLQTQDLHDLMWIREPFLSSEQDWGLCVVHGHAIEPEPVFRPNRMGLDTGAYRSGILTCAAIDADQVRIIQTP